MDKQIEELDTDELNLLKVEKEKKLQEYESNDAEISSEIYLIEKEIALKRIKLLELKQSRTMSASNIRRLRSELRVIDVLYWKRRRP